MVSLNWLYVAVFPRSEVLQSATDCIQLLAVGLQALLFIELSILLAADSIFVGGHC
ncbi:MAG: hypothetical protein ACFB16_25735 [Phormidesmis sp.]